MSKNKQFYAVSGFANIAVNMDDNDTTVAKILHTASEEGSVIKSLNVSSSDGAILFMELSILNKAGTVTSVLGTFAIPATAGQDAAGAIPSVNVLDSDNIVGLEKDIQGNNILKLGDSCVLRARMLATMSASPAQVDIFGSYDIFTAVA